MPADLSWKRRNASPRLTPLRAHLCLHTHHPAHGRRSTKGGKGTRGGTASQDLRVQHVITCEAQMLTASPGCRRAGVLPVTATAALPQSSSSCTPQSCRLCPAGRGPAALAAFHPGHSSKLPDGPRSMVASTCSVLPPQGPKSCETLLALQVQTIRTREHHRPDAEPL